jgi:large subunit ribosomal protein L3
MSQGILGTKVGMTQIFGEDGSAIPVTVIRVTPNVVVDKRTVEKNDYVAVQMGYEPVAERKLTKPRIGVFKKVGVSPLKVLKEFRISQEELDALKPGDELKADVFHKGQFVDVSGVSKGRGFAGVVKLFKMKGTARNAQSAHEYHRHIGSIGQRKTPGRVWKGKHMPRHMGVDRITVQNLHVVEVDLENNLILLHGAVPGHKGSLLTIQPSAKKKADKPILGTIIEEASDKKKKGKR